MSNSQLDATENKVGGEKRLVRKDVLITYIVLLVIGIFFLAYSLNYEFYRGGQEGRIGPGYLPRFSGALLALLSIGLLFQEIRKGSNLGGDSGVDEKEVLTSETTKKIIYILAVIAGALLLTPVLGLLVSLVAAIPVLTIFVEKMKVLPSLILTLGVAIVGYILFVQLLSIPMPMGIFEGVL